MNITKKEQIRMASEACGLSQKVVAQVMDAIDSVRYDFLITGNTCKMGDIGTLCLTEVKAKEGRQGINPITKLPCEYKAIPAHNRPKMKFTTKIKKEIKEITSDNLFA